MVDAVGSTEHGLGHNYGQMGQQVSPVTYVGRNSWCALYADCQLRQGDSPELEGKRLSFL